MIIMKSISYKIGLLVLTSLVVIACEDPIDWNVSNDQIKLVIQGRVTNEFKMHKIELTQTADYFNSDTPAPVEGADVTITDGEAIFQYSESEPGVYWSEVAFAGEVGKDYSLSINLQSPLGESSIYGATSTLLPPMNVDSLYHIKQPFDDGGGLDEEVGVLPDSVYILGIFGQEVEEVSNGYLFEVFVNEELETNTIFDVGTFTDDFLEGLYLEDFLVYEVGIGEAEDSVTMFMYSLEPDYIAFVQSIILESEGSEPLGLSGPPANVIGNISNGGLGYFYAASVDTTYTILE